METIEFITDYQKYLQEIRNVMQPHLISVIFELSEIDPHDLISPETYFISESHARGFVWSLFLQRIQKYPSPTH